MNAALALIEAVAPKDEVEAALAVQMAATHSAAMTVLERLGGGHGGERRVAALGSAAARLLRAYTHQVETLRRLRHGGEQLIPCSSGRLLSSGLWSLVKASGLGHSPVSVWSGTWGKEPHTLIRPTFDLSKSLKRSFNVEQYFFRLRGRFARRTMVHVASSL